MYIIVSCRHLLFRKCFDISFCFWKIYSAIQLYIKSPHLRDRGFVSTIYCIICCFDFMNKSNWLRDHVTPICTVCCYEYKRLKTCSLWRRAFVRLTESISTAVIFRRYWAACDYFFCFFYVQQQFFCKVT